MPIPMIWALAALAGAMMAVQTPTNAMLGRALGSPVASAFMSFVIGALLLGLVMLAAGIRPDFAAGRSVPWYAWVGGAYGAAFVAFAAFAAPRIGVAALITATIAGQLATALLLDHSGAIGLARQPVGVRRLSGVALVLAGALLVRRG